MIFARKSIAITAAALLWAALSAPASALTIELDYSLDASGFFNRTPEAKAAVEAAAADIGAVITSSLGAIQTDHFEGTQGGGSASVDWDLQIFNPGTGANFLIDDFNVAANTVRLYVGMRNLAGTTLGVGGPAGAAFETGVGSTNGNVSQIGQALDQAEASSNITMRRGGGPLMQTYEDTLTIPQLSAEFDYTLHTGAIVGSLSFDLDTDNNNVIDSDATLAAFWHYGFNTPVAAGKNDMYSVALHEILHTLGIGTSKAWEDLITGGNDWNGPHAITLAGSGNNLVTMDGHIANGLSSFRISDHGVQDPVMSPSLTVGTRKSLTDLDLAFLQDIGWTVVPEPGTGLLLMGALLPLAVRRRRAERVA